MPNVLKAIVADDHTNDREQLVGLLKQESDLCVLASAETVSELQRRIITDRPDLVFLSVEMEGMGCIQLNRLLKLNVHPFNIIFTTVSRPLETDLYGLDTADFLLKPYHQSTVNHLLQRLKYEYAVKNSDHKVQKFLVEEEDRFFLLDPGTIVFAAREEKSTVIHLSDGKTITTKWTLLELEHKLSAYPFFRTHRSYLVNLNMVNSFVPWMNGAYNLFLKDFAHTVIPVSRDAAKELFRIFVGVL